MQAIVETLFDIVYLFSVITIGILMIRKSKGNRQFTMFVIMAVLLGSGDVFHLVPRAVALCTTGLENFTVQLGLGKWITSITMTIFYVVPYHIWRERYQIKGHKETTTAIYGLAGLRQHRTIPALRLKHRSGGCGTASASPKCSIRHPVLSALLA